MPVTRRAKAESEANAAATPKMRRSSKPAVPSPLGSTRRRSSADSWLGGEEEDRSDAQSPSPSSEDDLTVVLSTDFRLNLEGAMEKPRSIAIMFLLLSIVSYIAFQLPEVAYSPEQKAALAAVTMLVGYGVLHCRDSVLVNPHPLFWRMTHSVGVCYLIFLVILLALGPEDGKHLLRQLVPSLQINAAEYDASATMLNSGTGDSCALTLDGFKKQLMSVWFISHSIGFIGKVWIFRDWRFVLMFSFAFEVFECSMAWLVPEFIECWWDSIFLDALGANIFGLVVGVGVMNLCDARTYNWMGHRRKSTSTNTSTTSKPYTLAHEINYNWRFVDNWPQFFRTGFMLAIGVVCEANAFFLIHSLELPKIHFINVSRLMVVLFVAVPGTREAYLYCVAEGNKRVGQNAWLFIIMTLVECLIPIRYGRPGGWGGSFPPSEIWIPLATSAVMWFVYLFHRFDRIEAGKKQVLHGDGDGAVATQAAPSKLEHAKLACAILPLVLLTKQWNWEA